MDHSITWSDFRTAVRYDPTSPLLLAVPAISAKRAEHSWLGEAVSLHTRVGDGEVHRREYERGTVYWTERHGTALVHGMVRDIWTLLGGERSALGLPVADVQFDATNGEFSGCFEHGSIVWSPALGPTISVAVPATSAADALVDGGDLEAVGGPNADLAPAT
ncbi:LGFP repeat-containing protein [Agromyces sp. Marseille-P2726]|uniref:LGFP repeat-containing protein n=1 Tax=Agromyces sp. Marseille-P2726 TaxID=2709132 RepID=UPI00156E87C9|nr:hypothetical protein [Agromyces sp. Marseille-P2726]